jgi:hypothetical protein
MTGAVGFFIGAVWRIEMSIYNDTALANARDQGLTSNEVEDYGLSQIAALADVTEPYPPDFFYVQVRAYVVQNLEADEAAAERAEEQKDLDAALRNFPRLQKYSIVDDSETGGWRFE